MRFTSRLRDRRISGALAVLAGLATSAALVTSCSNDEARALDPATADAGPDATSDAASTDGTDAADATSPPRPLPRSDAGPLAVDCASPSCATSLVTTVDIRPFEYEGDGFCALLHDGTVACWGQNKSGQLGGGATAPRDSATPKRVDGLSNIVALGHSCAVDADGATWCWGMGPYLRDESLPMTVETTPVKLAIPQATMLDFSIGHDVSTGRDFATACAVENGEVVCWGTNQNGQVDVPEPGMDPGAPQPPKAVAIPPGAPIRNIVVGNASFVLREDGTLLSWGANPPLGRTSSLFPDPYPKPLPLEGVTSVDVGGDNACATAQGIAYCWGTSPARDNVLGRALPEPLPMPEAVVQISAAATSLRPYETMGRDRGCACGVSGAVYCWGSNEMGQVGDGTTNFAFSPVKVTGLPAPAARVKTTPRATCAVLTTGQVYCWGDNFYGQLGSPPIKEPSRIPREVVLP